MGVEDRLLADLERDATDKRTPVANPFSFDHGMPFGLLRVTATGEASAAFVSVGPLRFEGREVLVKGAGASPDGTWVVDDLETSMPNARSFASAVGRDKIQQLQDALARNLARAASENEVVFLRRGLVALRQEVQRVDAAMASTEDEIRHRQARLANLAAQKARMEVDHVPEEGRMRLRMADLEALAAKPPASKARRHKP